MAIKPISKGAQVANTNTTEPTTIETRWYKKDYVTEVSHGKHVAVFKWDGRYGLKPSKLFYSNNVPAEVRIDVKNFIGAAFDGGYWDDKVPTGIKITVEAYPVTSF